MRLAPIRRALTTRKGTMTVLSFAQAEAQSGNIVGAENHHQPPTLFQIDFVGQRSDIVDFVLGSS